jgi:hypothetical protein
MHRDFCITFKGVEAAQKRVVMGTRSLGGCIGLLLALNVSAGVTLSKVSIAQREGTKLVDIFYDINSVATVSVTISNGASLVDATSFSGDIGADIPAGSGRQIIWDGGADFGLMLTTNLSITVSAYKSAATGLVYIPAGSAVGSDPAFSYSLTVDPFYMDATEITKDEWDAVTASGVSGSGSAGYPVYNVTWYEAALWCNARSLKEGLSSCYDGSFNCDFTANGYRLPTVVEWEYAARGGESGWLYPWGNSINYTNVNCTLNGFPHPDFSGFTSPVGSFAPNGFDLLDMAGNVWEWCWDFYGSDRKTKGGSWNSKQDEVRNGHFGYAPPDNEGDFLGFRTVRDASVPDAWTEIIIFDSRDYNLTVISEHGSPTPSAGTWAYAWQSVVTCSVEAVVNEGGTNYTCIGWNGTGSLPSGGSSNSIIVVLSDLVSSIIWNWATDDTDLDGMDDDWETAFFGDLGQVATNDFDSDGQHNLAEYIAGTNPTNPASYFKISGASSAPGTGFILHWPATSNRIYNVYRSDNLTYTDFLPMETNITFPRSSSTDSTHNAQGFYRIDVQKQ